MEIEPPAAEAAAALRPSPAPEAALPQADEELGQEERSLPRPESATPTVNLEKEGEDTLVSTMQSRARADELVRRSSPSSPVPRYSLSRTGPLQSLEDAVSFLTAAGAKGALPPRPWVMDDEGTVGCLYLEDLSHTRRHKHKSPCDKWRNAGELQHAFHLRCATARPQHAMRV